MYLKIKLPIEGSHLEFQNGHYLISILFKRPASLTDKDIELPYIITGLGYENQHISCF